MPSVTPRRNYRSALRKEQAAESRRRILDAAAECFARNGYTGTGLGDIAKAAGVSVELVKSNGPKRELLIRAFEQAFAGSEGDDSLEQRAAVQQILSIRSNTEFFETLVAYIIEANARTMGVWQAFVSAANSDPEVAESLNDLLARRRQDFERAIEVFKQRGMLRASAGASGLADTFCYLLAPEGLEHFVSRSGWTRERYRDWVIDTARALVLDEGTALRA